MKSDIDFDIALAALDVAHNRHTITCTDVLTPYALGLGIALLWEHGVRAPVVAMSGWQMRDILDAMWDIEGDHPKTLIQLAKSMFVRRHMPFNISPISTWGLGTYRGTAYGSPIYVSHRIPRNKVAIYDPDASLSHIINVLERPMSISPAIDRHCAKICIV